MIRLYILILIIIVILILLYIYLTSGNQGASSNQFLKQSNEYLLNLFNSKFYNYKWKGNSCFIHSSLQLLRTFFSLLVIDNKNTLNDPYINTLLNFNAFDTNRNLYFPDIDNRLLMNYGQHDVMEFLTDIFRNIISNIAVTNNIITLDNKNEFNIGTNDVLIKVVFDIKSINARYIQNALTLQLKDIELNEYIIIYLQGKYIQNVLGEYFLRDFIFTDVTNDIVIKNDKYSPYSIIQYAGSGNGGHYINYSKKPNTQDLKGQWSWYKYDDVTQKEAIVPKDDDNGITKNPTVILYKRIKK